LEKLPAIGFHLSIHHISWLIVSAVLTRPLYRVTPYSDVFADPILSLYMSLHEGIDANDLKRFIKCHNFIEPINSVVKIILDHPR
jgi:hypothetical protein